MTKPREKDAEMPAEKTPPAGPHAKPQLNDNAKTPGSGVTPKPDDKKTEAPTG